MTELPHGARLKLAQIVGQSNDARDAAASANERIKQLRTALADPGVKNAGDIEHELARLSGVRDQQQRRHSDLSTLAGQISNWLRQLPGNVVLEPARVRLAKLNDGETLSKAIARIRTQITKIDSELKAARTAPPTKAELKAKAAQHVLKLVQEGKPRISPQSGEIDFSGAAHGVGARKVASMLAWSDPDGLLRALERDIDAMQEHPNAMSGDKKKTIMARLTAELDQLERAEENLIEQAHADGSDIARRALASPQAVLGVVQRGKEVRAA